MKFVSPLNEAAREGLDCIYRNDKSFKRRIRAHAVLLSSRGYRLEQLADIFVADRDTVSQWLKNWEERAFDGLSDAPRQGRPRKTSQEEDALLLREIERHPQQIAAASIKLKDKKISVSPQTIRRRLREAGYRYKRVVKRPANAPEEKEYERCKRRLKSLEKQEARGAIELVYADAAGFSLKASQPMAWQHPNRAIALPAQDHRERLNVFGFLRKTTSLNRWSLSKASTKIALLRQ